MNAKNLQNVLQSLSEAAFVRVDGERFRWDPLKGKGPLRQELPWQIQEWEFDAGRGEVSQTAFVIRLNAEQFLLNLEDDLRQRFPSFRKASLETDKKGGFWLLVEFLDPSLDADQSRLIENDEASIVELPHGLAALHLSVIQAVGQVSIFMTKHCLLGNTPGPFFIELPKILNQALFGAALQDKTNFNSYLLTLRSEELRTTLIEFCRLPEAELEIVTRDDGQAFGQVKLTFEGKDWEMAWVSGEEMPELLVPPMEILEQKEVARRFQRLDELILLEDYQGAFEQCRDYLEKYPQSLYLVRRWAFLSLWAGRPFERKYLDLMAKYDPQNLMTLSLSVRDALASGDSDGLLESLSRLGSTLGQSVADFDALDITSLTLPEMLGDAWNHKDDQRAVSCYERVLSARGEIPRILVKLIRLMRDIDDSSAEETYMDRLLACEVPTRTRAAIYYRLAEIKQKSDPAAACEWALKSWHTHRMQIRYAVLAADLLIELERPHDAVHVLVETSELLEGDVSEARIGLELKIASIWLAPLQRLDLASERVSRALETVGSHPDSYDEIIRLVERFEDAPLLLDVTMKALHLAEGNNDSTRASRYAERLLQAADSAQDQDQRRAAYVAALRSTLLPAEQIQDLMSQGELALPFPEIAEAMERMVDKLPAMEQAPYHLLFGELAQDGLDDSETVYRHFEKALTAGLMSPRSFDFLDAYYSRTGMNKQRFQLLEKKLSQAKGGERAVLLRELYYFDEDISDRAKDEYALQILQEDADDVGPAEERLSHYESQGDGEGIIALLLTLSAYKLEAESARNLIRKGLASIKALGSSRRDEHCRQLLSLLQDQGEDPIEIARLTLEFLWDAEDKGPVRNSIVQLLDHGVLPNRPLDASLSLLEGYAHKLLLLARAAEQAMGETDSGTRDAINTFLRGLVADGDQESFLSFVADENVKKVLDEQTLALASPKSEATPLQEPEKENENERAITVVSPAREQETLYSAPRAEEGARDFETSATFPPKDPAAHDAFSLSELTDVGQISGSESAMLVGEVDMNKPTQFAFDSFREDEPAADLSSASQNAGPISFRLESTQTQARPLETLANEELQAPPLPPADFPSPPPLPATPAGAGEFSQTLISSVRSEEEPALPLSSMPDLPDPLSPPDELEASAAMDLSGDWKKAAISARAEGSLLQGLLAHPLADFSEQIIAVQVAALVEDKLSSLQSYPHRIWRDPSTVSYELKWTSRMTREQFHPGIKAPLARLLKALYPLFVKVFSHEMGLAGVADRLKMRGEEILRVRKAIDFKDDVLMRSNLRYYVAAFQESGYSLYHLPSIGDRFQFDFEKRDIYIDRNHYMAAPPSHIFHRLAFLLRAVSLDYFPFLNLSPSGEIYPFLMKCKRSLDQVDGMKRVLGLEKDPVRQLLAQAKDREQLAALFAEVGTLSADRISLSVSHFIEQIYRLNLAETLDLIGLVETIAGVDLTHPRASSSQRIGQSSSARSILAFAAELGFTKP